MPADNDNLPPGLGGVPPGDSIWTQVRKELRVWFREKAPSLAPAYEGAVELLGNTAFPGRLHFIAHAVRDIADRLVFVLDPQIEGSRVQYEQKLDAIGKQWQTLDHPYRAEANLDASDTVSLPRALAEQINLLVAEHLSRRKRPSHYELLFRFLMRTDSSRGQVNKRIVKAFKDVREWFMDLTHLRRAAPPSVDEHELQRRFGSLERMLHSFVGDFFTGASELDAILRQANQ